MTEPAEDARNPHLPEWVSNQKEKSEPPEATPADEADDEGQQPDPTGGSAD